MQFLDGHAYALNGLKGAFKMDASVSIMVCAGLLGLLGWLRMRSPRKTGALTFEAAE